MTIPNSAFIHWTENDKPQVAIWQSEANATPPKRVVLADDTLAADAAYRLVCEGVGLLWRGDFQNAKQLLQALARRVDKARQKKSKLLIRLQRPFINIVQRRFSVQEFWGCC